MGFRRHHRDKDVEKIARVVEPDFLAEIIDERGPEFAAQVERELALRREDRTNAARHAASQDRG